MSSIASVEADGVPASRHLLVALLAAALTAGVLVATAPSIGLTWDEPAYIAASESYVQWLERLWSAPGYALSPQGVRAYWDINHEHPPLDKVWSGLVWSGARHVLDDLTAHRLGNILLAAALAGVLYLTVARSFGVAAGLGAVAALFTMPRFFFHAHLAALDVPAAAAVFAVTALFWHTRGRGGIGWDLLLGLTWGAALATKINALFVLPTLFVWLLLFDRRLRLVARLAIAGAVGLPLFVLLWPWLYHDTWERLVGYVRFITVDHWEIGQYYLGAWHMPPPWHFAPVMLVAVTPLALLLLAGLGLVRGARGRSSLVLLWALSVLVPLLALAIGQTKVYDNERLFMPVFPFLAALAGMGLGWLTRGVAAAVRRAGQPSLAAPAAGLVAAALFVPHIASATVLAPHLLSYYSEGVGGLPGAVRLRLETTYWCETYAAALPAINERARPGDVVWAEPWSHDVLLYYQLQGRLRPDVRVAMTPGSGTLLAARGAEGVHAEIGEADFVIVSYRETGLTVHPQIIDWTGGREPVLRVERFGVPLVELYER
ncbi:MAG: hypothetical protein RLZZ387_1299 [Chloroflexota bacterium]|jgi:4-amino-4-deoxy-L-arabinose transferase-like glycosyltransferase